MRGFGLLAGSVIWLLPALLAAQEVSGGVSASLDDGISAEANAAADQGEPTAQPAQPNQPNQQNQQGWPEADTLRRAHNTWFGSTGGVRVIDGASGVPGTLRFQLGFDYFGSSDYLQPNDTHRATSGTLSLSATPVEHLELFGAVASRASSNSLGNPILLQVAGDFSLGVKGYLQVLPWLSVGADVRGLLMNTIGDVGISAKGTSGILRLAATADFRRSAGFAFPAILRANVGYMLDNSSKLIEQTEDDRYNALSTSSRRPRADEDRHLINRIERFGLGINRVDTLKLALGLEVPLKLASDFFVQPLVEWQLGIPVNRQHFDCLSVPTDATYRSADGCLAVNGLDAAPSTLTLGVRVLPPVRGLSALLAFDIGLLGTSVFVRELAPTRPWALLVSLGYAVDMSGSAQPEVKYVEKRVEVAVPEPTAPRTLRVRGEVVERGTGKPVIGAVVRYPGRALTPQLTSADGVFISYELPANTATLTLEITHPDYESAPCEVAFPAPAASPAQANPAQAPGPSRSALTPIGAGPQPSPPPAAISGESFVAARCELAPSMQTSTLVGAVTDAAGKPLANVQVELNGPVQRTLTSGPAGEFNAEGLPAGEYTAEVNGEEYLFKREPVVVVAGSDASVRLTLTPRPRVSQALLTSREVKIGTQIVFQPSSAEVDARSAALLAEVVDVLAHNPQVRVQVQGHTDNSGDQAQNMVLSQQRADAVRTWLVNAGIDASRIEAKGFGDEQPLVPNLTPENRARNRRVQFMLIKE